MVLSLSLETTSLWSESNLSVHRAKQIFPHLSRTKLILSSDVESLSLSFSLERTGGKRRVCESVWRRTRMIMVMDRGIFICEWREKLYVVGRRNVKREGGKAATERKNCNGLVTLFFFFFFILFFRAPPIYHADDDAVEESWTAMFYSPFSPRCPFDPWSSSIFESMLYPRDPLSLLFSFVFFFENSCPRRNRRMNYFCGNEKRDVIESWVFIFMRSFKLLFAGIFLLVTGFLEVKNIG